MLGMKSK